MIEISHWKQDSSVIVSKWPSIIMRPLKTSIQSSRKKVISDSTK